VDFSASINPLGVSPRAAAAIRSAVKYLPFYPDNDCTRLRNAIASYIGNVAPENILVGNGATEVIHLFTQVFLERGDEAIILEPTFSEYEYATILHGATPISVPMEDGFKLEPDTLLKSITPRTRAIFLCNPNNPTSTTLDRSDVEAIVDEAAKRKIMVLLDECFIEFVEDGDKLSLSRDSRNYRNLIVLRSLTKVFGLAGLRVGYAVSNKENIALLDNFRVTWSVNTLAQIAGIAALSDLEYLDETKRLIRQERAFLKDSLSQIGVSITPPKANFLLADLQDRMAASELKKRLLTYRILIRDCSAFRGLGSRFVRFAIRTRNDDMTLLRALGEELHGG
jgi:threonine-phosphate decarboxylase